MVLDGVIHPNDADGIDEAVEVVELGPTLARIRVARVLLQEGEAIAREERFHPLALDLEELDGAVDEVLEVVDKRVSVVFGLIRRTRDVERDDVPRAHRKVRAVSEVELVLKVLVLVSIDLEHIRAALVAGDALARATVLGNHVVEVGRAELGRERERGLVVVLNGGDLGVTVVKVLGARHDE